MKTNNINFRKYILPVSAGMIAVIAAIVLIFVPRKDEDKNTIVSSSLNGGSSAEDVITEPDVNGEIVIRADSLSGEQVRFIRISDGSKIELLARLGDDGTAKVALGTCQSCNGAPGAYYTQEGEVLRCNNCRLTFPLSVIDSPGGGCHPIMLDDAVVSYSDGNAIINLQALSAYDSLFAEVSEH